MKSRFAGIAVSGLMLALSAVPLQLLTTSTAYAADVAPAAMTNADVVKLAKLGFGPDVIKTKIDSASSVNFKTEVDDLIALKSAGVSQDVISEMMKRASGGATGVAGVPAGAMVGNPGDVTMVTTDGANVHLRGISG